MNAKGVSFKKRVPFEYAHRELMLPSLASIKPSWSKPSHAKKVSLLNVRHVD